MKRLFSAEERTQMKRKELNHERFVETRAQSRHVEYKFGRQSDSLKISAAFKSNDRLPLALRDN